MDNFKKLGNINQIACTKRIEYKNGKANSVLAILCKNERLSFTLLESMALDIFDLSYAGNNMSFISKNGLVSRNLANTNAFDFSKSFSGGFLYTCGLDNIGKPEEGKLLHGSFSSIPALITKEQTLIENGKIVLEVEGEIRDTALFSKDISVARNYKIYSNKIILTDKLINRGFLDQDIIMLYHFNLGYPMVDSCTRFNANISNTECRTEHCVPGTYNIMSEPVDKCFEEVFIHSIDEDAAKIEVENTRLKQKIIFSYSTKFLKYLMEWKSMQSGDYVLGIEPATSHLDDKRFITLKNGQSIENQITIDFVAG
jgi:hypothetical protein